VLILEQCNLQLLTRYMLADLCRLQSLKQTGASLADLVLLVVARCKKGRGLGTVGILVALLLTATKALSLRHLLL
jgi:hypothetical protein